MPVAIWMAFIFVMSSDLGSAAHTSRIIEPLILWINPNASPETLEHLHFLIRKFGHLSEYAVLALLVLRAVTLNSAVEASAPRSGERQQADSASTAELRIRLTAQPTIARWSWRRAGIALLIAAAYAATDEWHQSFVPSRTAAFDDVLIDSTGALIGLSLVFLWCKLTPSGLSFQAKRSPQVEGADR
jgi:VanZ family protein